MSYRRSISFADDEKELLEYFDENGKSDIAKEAMIFYRDNKDRVISPGVISLLKEIGIGATQQTSERTQRPSIQEKINKVKK
jgi:hypothetical protein